MNGKVFGVILMVAGMVAKRGGSLVQVRGSHPDLPIVRV